MLYIIIWCFCSTESLNVEFVCNVLVVADQLLITRLKEMCEVVITENRKLIFFFKLHSFFGDILLSVTVMSLMLEVTSSHLRCFLCDFTVNLKNAAELLEFATMYNAEQLKLSCFQFIVLNITALLELK